MWFLESHSLLSHSSAKQNYEKKSDSFRKQRNALATADARAAQTIASRLDIILSEGDGLQLEGSNPNNQFDSFFQTSSVNFCRGIKILREEVVR